ncbi:MAG: transcription antitermination factor NusB [Actinomycetes bacterium]
MSARTKARKAALDILFEADIRGTSTLDLLNQRLVQDEGEDARPVRVFTQELIIGIEAHRRKIDELITTYAQGWDMDRLPNVDRNVLRLAIFEILWAPDVPDAVVIDEALTLVKELSTDDSGGYVHGVLGRVSAIKDDLSL